MRSLYRTRRWGQFQRTVLAAIGVSMIVPAFAAADRFVYVSNGFPAGSNNISALRINSNGSLTPVSGSPFATGGTTTEGLSITPDAQHLYVATFGTSDVRGFNITGTGGLSAVSGSPFAAGNTPLGTAPAPDGSRVFAWNHGSSIGSWTIGSGGSLSQASGSPFSVPAGQTNPFAGSVAPDGQHLYVPNENATPVMGVETNRVTAYSVASNGALSSIQSIQTGNASAAGSNPFGSGITPDGKFLYVSNPEDGTYGTLSGFSVGSTGLLTALPGFPLSLNPGSHPLNIAISPDGQHLYVATRITSTVNAYNINSNGSLSAISGQPFATGGTNGKALAFTPDGKRLYVSNNVSNNVSGFNVASDGSLSLISGSPWPTGGTNPDLESIAITPNQGPTASFITHSKPKRKVVVKLNGTPSGDPDGTVATYDYDYGDGDSHQSVDGTVQHKYTNAGTYTIALTVTDDEGCSAERIFTGKATLCNGSAVAEATQDVAARKLFIDYFKGKGRFGGQVGGGGRKACKRDEVTVFKKRPGKDHKVGSDHSDKAGRWRVEDRNADGTFYAQVKKKILGDGTICLARKSRKLKVG